MAEHPIEIVERKGRGHPDSICDCVMEAVSVALSQAYRREFGAILHYNVDKGLLAAGSVKKTFGGGRVIKPMELIIGDRATFGAGGKKIPVADIAVGAARQWIGGNLRLIDPERHVRYRVVLAPGSEELSDIFVRPGKVRCANDTSAAVGYYPLSQTEKAVLELERHLNSKAFKQRHPETGEDIKVMGLRRGTGLEVSVAMPLITAYVESERAYFEKKTRIISEVKLFLRGFQGFKETAVHLNSLDEQGRGMNGIYLSLLGTSAEDADSGQVGRGNRVNGLISMNRPMGTEAAAGKNPVSHVGKIYNVLSHKIAKELYESIDGIKEVYVLLLSRIGTPIDRPQMATAQIILEKGRMIREIAATARSIFEKEFSEIHKFCMELSKGRYPVC